MFVKGFEGLGFKSYGVGFSSKGLECWFKCFLGLRQETGPLCPFDTV